MNAVEFLHEMKRMCDSRDSCVGCAAVIPCKGDVKVKARNAEMLVNVVSNWSKANPIRTYADDFVEKFPNAKMYRLGYPMVCRRNVYGEDCDCSVGCDNCWSAEL